MGGVLEPRIPSLCSASPTENPGVSFSTMNALIPRVPRPGSVFAKTMYTSAYGALVMNILVPLRAYPSACSVAVVVPRPASGAARGVVGQGESAQTAPGCHVRQIALLLGLGPEPVYRPGSK